MAKQLDLFGNIVSSKLNQIYEKPGNTYEQFVERYYQRYSIKSKRKHKKNGDQPFQRTIKKAFLNLREGEKPFGHCTTNESKKICEKSSTRTFYKGHRIKWQFSFVNYSAYTQHGFSFQTQT